MMDKECKRPIGAGKEWPPEPSEKRKLNSRPANWPDPYCSYWTAYSNIEPVYVTFSLDLAKIERKPSHDGGPGLSDKGV